MKYILNVKQSTPHVMLYGELGRFPLSLIIKKTIIKFWSNLLLGKLSKLSYRLYSILYNDANAITYEFPWTVNVKSILDDLGMSYIWISQTPQNSEWLANTVLQMGQGQYKQLWSASVHESSKCVNYKIFKTEHKFENYLLNPPFKLRKIFINYRLCNNKLPIETGRWLNTGKKMHYVIQMLLVMSFITLLNAVLSILIGKYI